MTGEVELYSAYAVLTFLIGYYVNNIRSRLLELESRIYESSQEK